MAITNTGSADAVGDILNNPRFHGALDTVSWLTEFVDSYFVMFISIVAFFIISGALLRNVIAGAYAAFPKFWDAIAEAKENLASQNKSIGGRDVSIIFRISSWFFPDFKKLSDFHDNNVEPKDYFIKAIPQMVGIVMIGVVIYNGLYRDGVAMTSNFGTELINRVILNVDPVAVFDRIFENASRPDFATANDTSSMGKYAEKVSKKIYSDTVTYWTDITSKSAKSALTQNIEDWVLSQMEESAEFWDENKYKISTQVDRVLGAPNLDRLSNGDTDVVTTQAWTTPVTGFGFDSAQHLQEDWHVRFVARFEKIPEKASKSRTLSKLELAVPASAVAVGGDKLVISIPNADKFVVSGTKITVNGKPATWEAATGKLTIAMVDDFRTKENMKLSITAFGYKAEDAKGTTRTHTIRALKIGSDFMFDQGDVSFKVGDGPDFGTDQTEDKEKKTE